LATRYWYEVGQQFYDFETGGTKNIPSDETEKNKAETHVDNLTQLLWSDTTQVAFGVRE
jgi:hypothetical protein